jgi:hypothetical protein
MLLQQLAFEPPGEPGPAVAQRFSLELEHWTCL